MNMDLYEKSILDWSILDSFSKGDRIRWDYLSLNPSLSLDVYKKYSHMPWEMILVTRHKNITIKEIFDNLEYPWNINEISQKTDVTMDFVKEHPDFPWNYGLLARVLPVNDIFDNPQYHWKFDFNFYYRRDQADVMRAYPKYNWNWKDMFRIYNCHDCSDVQYDQKQDAIVIRHDFSIKRSDVNSGWNILEIAKESVVDIDLIKKNFPDEFDLYCQTNNIGDEEITDANRCIKKELEAIDELKDKIRDLERKAYECEDEEEKKTLFSKIYSIENDLSNMRRRYC